MQITKDLWVSEYSVKQGCFHVETLEDAITNNMRSIMRHISTDYAIFGVHKSYEEASAAIKKMERHVSKEKS